MTLKRIKWINKIWEANDGIEFLDIVFKLKPDVVLMDIKIKGLNGIAATKKAT